MGTGRSGAGYAALTDPVIATALHHIHHEPTRRWTVQDLGDTIGMSRTAFTRRFTSLVGQPPLAYLTWWRLNTGARLLQDTDAPLASIARQVGYTSEYAFTNAFRREFGTAPGRFRWLSWVDERNGWSAAFRRVRHVRQAGAQESGVAGHLDG
ncbi:helix-turn-helix transcriptional regulator [Nonomuraea lactucae]|uniref:helix-turn-helix transcriptional regulator n=1 Tax=Nonomuraea lactucae TaxID=2249762 RepID=UPI001F050688|nr:AraC family transcriptional regulator [Nonomuraea lactucae]